jgi:hypothetical protein
MLRHSFVIRHSCFVIRSSFVIRASSFVCPLLLCPSCRKQPPARSRSMSFAASPRFRSSDRPNYVAILTIHPRRRQMSNACSRMEGAGKPRHRSQNPRDEGESAESDRIKAFGGYFPTLPTSVQYGRSRFPGARYSRIVASVIASWCRRTIDSGHIPECERIW